MRAYVLDRFNEGRSVGVLCRVNFSDYVSHLPTDYRDYFVQRGITTNRYLDNLWETIVEKKHIPLLVIVASDEDAAPPKASEVTLREGWKILDGLQRSHRMKLLFEIVQYQLENVDQQANLLDEPDPIPKEVKKHRDWLLESDCPTSLFVKVLRTKRKLGQEAFKRVFEDISLWLEVWFGLDENEQIQKMLILNAGHKSVNIKHQIELLFSDYFTVLERNLGGRAVIRERDKSSIIYSKSRNAGQFHFSHLVTAFQSLDEGKPVSTNADFAAEKSLSMPSVEDSKLEINVDLLEAFAKFLCKLDQAFSQTDTAVKWLGREVVLAGLFAAVGKHSEKIGAPKTEVLLEFSGHLAEFKEWLNLDEFEQARNSLNLAKVNIGNKNKFAVQSATLNYLSDYNSPNPNWNELFGGGHSDDL
ncbi:hypothetical protein SAMN04488056_111193 [Cohaesibacter marisflavi]|uniref:DUF262 domain-containing protein n=1 Tax=Cohaesibacter marisflavi TaxID=655353 RepID=A0A1I5JJE8_9HYPH|nr:hypothetical protein [Cohaesibacter marisflavi]SFO72799.1 hypothetical protein SAMN04488056_111193 [Cohaesibacter marisflavi]